MSVRNQAIDNICDQLDMSRLPRNTFALMPSLLPAIATIVGAIVLAQIPMLRCIIGILFVMAGVAIHRPASS